MMSSNENHIDEKINNLIDAQIIDLIEASDEDINVETSNIYDSPELAIQKCNSLIEKAISNAGTLRFINAKKGLKQNKIKSGNVIEWSLTSKKRLLASVQSTYEGLTIAARLADEETENDITIEIEDLIDLGVIDEEGNLL